EVPPARLVAAVVRCRVERGLRTALREHARRRVAAHLEREHAGHVGFEGECLHVEHQTNVLLERVRNPGRRFGQLPCLAARVLALDELDPPLELTDVLEIALEPLPIVRAQVATELADSAGHPVENAAPGAPTQSAFLGRATCSEELFER